MSLSSQYRWLKTILSLSSITLLLIFISYHLDWIGTHVLAYQFEKVGLAIQSIDKVNVGWRRASFHGIKLRPLNNRFLPTHGELSIEKMSIRYLPKDLLLHRFREVRIDGVSGNLAIGSSLSYTGECPLSPDISMPRLDASNHAISNKINHTHRLPNTLTVQNFRVCFNTPAGCFWMVGGLHINDFFSKTMSGQGKVLLRSPFINLNIALKADKIEPRIWRLSGDVNNGILNTPATSATDINGRIEWIFGSHSIDINGRTLISHLKIPALGLQDIQNLEGDFKSELNHSGELESRIVLKVPNIAYKDRTCTNASVSAQIDGTMKNPIESAQIDFSAEEISYPPYLKNWVAKLKSLWKQNKFEYEGTCSRLPAVINLKGKYENNILSGLFATSAPIIWDPASLQPDHITDLASGMSNVSGKTELKSELSWNITRTDLQSNTTLTLSNINFKANDETRLENLRGEIQLDGLWTHNDPAQTLLIDKIIKPNFFLENVQVDYHLRPNHMMDILVVSGLYNGKRKVKVKDFSLNLSQLGQEIAEKLA